MPRAGPEGIHTRDASEGGRGVLYLIKEPPKASEESQVKNLGLWFGGELYIKFLQRLHTSPCSLDFASFYNFLSFY